MVLPNFLRIRLTTIQLWHKVLRESNETLDNKE
jgi:hypothetical protein